MRWFIGGLGVVAVIVLSAAVAYWALLPPRLPVADKQDQILSGVTILNPGVAPLPNQSIVIEDGRIQDIRPRRADDPAPLCAGCYALPGLIDAHVHTPPRVAVGNQELFALLYLMHGVTSVRDVGQSDGSIGGLARRLKEGALVGPYMYRCGPIIESPPTSWPLAKVVSTAEEGRAAVADLADQGVDCIKVYNELTPEAFDAIAAAAKDAGLPLVGHVPHALKLDEISDFESQHFTGVPYLTRPRPPHGTDFRDEDVNAMGRAEVERVFAVAKENRISFTPILANLSLRLIASDPSRFPPTDGAQYLPAYWAGAWNLIAGHPNTEAAIRLRVATQPLNRALALAARNAGADVLAGTDTLMPWVIPGESLHLEIAALAQAFGDREAALAAATRVNGKHIAPGEIGFLEIGRRADILLLSEDPRADLSALRRFHVVIAGGRVYARQELEVWGRSYRDHFRGGYYAAVMGTIIGWVVGDYSHVEGEG